MVRIAEAAGLGLLAGLCIRVERVCLLIVLADNNNAPGVRTGARFARTAEFSAITLQRQR
jgi:hypothetical protein